jgi:hypothetical protein
MMTRSFVIAALTAGSILASRAQAQLVPPAPMPAPGAAPTAAMPVREVPKPLPLQYQPLLQRSMFTKDRLRRPGDFSNQPRIPTQPRAFIPSPPAVPFLTGVLLETDDIVGFLEDPNTHKVSLIREGDTLPNGLGTVDKITLNYILVRSSPRLEPKKIEVGYNLAGVQRTSSSSYSSPITYTPPTIYTRNNRFGSNGGGPNGAGPNGADPNAAPGADAQVTDPVEQMRLQRMVIELQAQQLQTQGGQPAGDGQDAGGGGGN